MDNIPTVFVARFPGTRIALCAAPACTAMFLASACNMNVYTVERILQMFYRLWLIIRDTKTPVDYPWWQCNGGDNDELWNPVAEWFGSVKAAYTGVDVNAFMRKPELARLTQQWKRNATMPSRMPAAVIHERKMILRSGINEERDEKGVLLSFYKDNKFARALEDLQIYGFPGYLAWRKTNSLPNFTAAAGSRMEACIGFFTSTTSFTVDAYPYFLGTELKDTITSDMINEMPTLLYRYLSRTATEETRFLKENDVFIIVTNTPQMYMVLHNLLRVVPTIEWRSA